MALMSALSAPSRMAPLSPRAQREGQCVDQDRLARTGFPGKDREAGVKVQFGLFNNDKITDMQGTEHEYVLL